MLTQKELNRLYKSYGNWENFDEGIQEYRDKLNDLGAHCISYDWKQGSEAVNEFIKLLTENGFLVLEDPEFQDSDMYGWVVFPPKKTKE